MKKSLKGMSILLVIAALSITAACSNDTNASKKKETTNDKEYVSKTVNNMNMKINSIHTTDNAKGDKNMVEIKMTIDNKDSGEASIGAGDFKIKADKKTYDVFPQGNNFGDVIEKGKKLTGSAYFELPKSVKEGKLIYIQNKKDAATWDISIPKAE
ncbi:hypothetical protein X560_2706 [Listeria fleischmannii 1991]|uniref:Telomeric repeat-binding factor 2 n=2 Tax=Listeria fleischmannii TaxID=1069827 RepID=A0A2X3GUF5_9LIST|nr:DUF4352 domain-containing protein [Listeria fleischmannii]EMG28723.1 hypothetical protein LFLEISCH_04040 [Listeria fleischmannii subsp. fleischmannii LU2006-1]KMT57693.1 hypothetical protein X560_2706 [Listeria fleischmannii 1991]SQC71882.1 Telomeric repeat-binding factor 2 [Listeria fleischmannii subsp. fleischmannii]